jgi:hypothetical protein
MAALSPEERERMQQEREADGRTIDTVVVVSVELASRSHYPLDRQLSRIR